MFTGLVEECGKLVAKQAANRGIKLRFAASVVTNGLQLGDSISVNGVCQTVTAFTEGWFEVEAVGDTLDKTSLGKLSLGHNVNLERACLPTTRLGGHLVQGHVSGTGTVLAWQAEGQSYRLELSLPETLRRYVVAEGSICLDGISLTVAQIWADKLRVNVIPHSRAQTNLLDLAVGDVMNIEVDILAKYVESLLSHTGPGSRLNETALRSWGY